MSSQTTPTHPTTGMGGMPLDPDSIRATVLAYNLPHTETNAERTELEQWVKTGTPAVRVYCRSDSGLGWNGTALISSGIKTADGRHFIPAHDPIIYNFRKVDGRLNATENAKRLIWRKDPRKSRLVTPEGLPVLWENDTRVC